MQKKRSPDGASAEKSASSTAPSTEGAKRRKFLSPSEVRTALQEAAEEIDLLKAELTKARTQNNQWLQLQQTIGA